MPNDHEAAFAVLQRTAEQLDLPFNALPNYLASRTFNENTPPLRLAVLMGASRLGVAEHFAGLPLSSVGVVLVTGGIGRSTQRLFEELRIRQHPACRIDTEGGRDVLKCPEVQKCDPHGRKLSNKPIFTDTFEFSLPPTTVAAHATEADVFTAVVLHSLGAERPVRVVHAYADVVLEDCTAIHEKLFGAGGPGKELHIIVENGSTQTGANVELSLAALRKWCGHGKDNSGKWRELMKRTVVVQQPMLQLRSELTFETAFGARPWGAAPPAVDMCGAYSGEKAIQLWAALGEEERLRTYPGKGFIAQPPAPPRVVAEWRLRCRDAITALSFDGL